MSTSTVDRRHLFLDAIFVLELHVYLVGAIRKIQEAGARSGPSTNIGQQYIYVR